MNVFITNFKPYQKNSLLGFFDLQYEGLTIKRCSLFGKNDGQGINVWFTPPSQKKVEANGTTTYEPFIEVSNDLKQRIEPLLKEFISTIV